MPSTSSTGGKSSASTILPPNEALIEEFAGRTGATRAAEWVGIDRVVHPDDTRDAIVTAFERYDRRAEGDRPAKKHAIHPI